MKPYLCLIIYIGSQKECNTLFFFFIGFRMQSVHRTIEYNWFLLVDQTNYVQSREKQGCVPLNQKLKCCNLSVIHCIYTIHMYIFFTDVMI